MINDMDVSSMYAYQPPDEQLSREMQLLVTPRTAQDLLRLRTKQRLDIISVMGCSLSNNPLVVGKTTIILFSDYCRRIENMLICEFQKHGLMVSPNDCLAYTDVVYYEAQTTEFIVDNRTYVRFNKRARERAKKIIKQVVNRIAQHERKKKT